MCWFCEPEKYKNFPDAGKFITLPQDSEMKMEGNEILLTFHLGEYDLTATMTVSYCPGCGRKVTKNKQPPERAKEK